MRVQEWLGWAVLLSFAALSDLWVGVRPDPPLVSGAVMQQAGALIRAQQRSGDILAYSPNFSVSEIQSMGDLHLEMRPDVPTELQRSGHRVLVLDRADHPMGGLGTATQTIPVSSANGAVLLRIFEPQGIRPGTALHLIDQLGLNTMWVERPAGIVHARCREIGADGAYVCPGEPEWVHLERKRMQVDGREVSCVWAHPTGLGVVVVAMEVPNSGQTQGWKLQIETALSDDAVQFPGDGGEVRTEIWQAGRLLDFIQHGCELAWIQKNLMVRSGAPLEFRVTTTNDARRHHCINAELTP